MIKAGIIGASGYIGLEIVRLLSVHPKTEISVITSRRYKGMKIGDVYPYLQGISDMEYEDVDVKRIARLSDVVFTAVSHGSAMRYVKELLREGVKVIDMSADYRLDGDEYERVYRRRHEDRENLKRAVYGLTEVHIDDIKEAELVANPGCYPTGAVLAVAPLLVSDLKIKVREIIFDAKSGITGGGIEPSERSHFPNLSENIIPYEITDHRHLAEMRKELKAEERRIGVHFTPHVIPCIRGILTTSHVLAEEIPPVSEIEDAYREFYNSRKFVRFPKKVPSLSCVRGSNFCDIGVWVDKSRERIVVISAIDNLVKGGAGQAIQNMNVMFGMREEEGLLFPGLGP